MLVYRRLFSSSARQLSSKAAGTRSSGSRGNGKFRTGLLLSLGVGATAYAASENFREDVNFAGHAFQRSTTVAIALARCVFHYRRVLRASYNSEEERNQAIKQCHKQCALITRGALERNAGVFIKLGQHISALSYIFPEEWTRTMIPLQDQCPVSSYESVCELIQTDTGRSVDELFSEFNREPMGTASLAQVHHAKLIDGSEAAVKIQHPSLKEFIPLDLRLTETVFQMVDYFFPEYPLLWLSDEMKRSIYVELDFTVEAENAQKTAEYFSKHNQQTALRIPKVFWAKPRILCMEFVKGIRPDHKDELQAAGIDPKRVSLCFAHIFNDMIFTPGVGLHCDPHAGNVAIRPTHKNKLGFEVVLYDHGLYRYVDTSMRESYAKFWLAVIDNDEAGMRRYSKEFAGITDSQFKLFIAAITGRDFDSTEDGSVTRRKRSPEEIRKMQKALQEDSQLAPQIMQMLHQMPPVILLILKTNDLVRYLDEELGSPLGIVKQFAIMARYCARTVFIEEKSRATGGWGYLKAIAHYLVQQVKITALQLVYG